MIETNGKPVSAGLAERAEVLIEALPYLQQFRDALVVVKYGGAAMVDDRLADSWARDVVLLEHVGLRPLVVHGGGPALTRTMKRMGIETEFVDGHRVTDADSAEIAEMVLSGRINKEVVSRLNRAGGLAVGLSGTDAGMLRVRRHRPGGKDIGFVARVEAVDTKPLQVLIENDYLPVLSSTAADGDGQPHNINADLVAGAVAGAVGAEKLIFLSDTPGVLVKGSLQRLLSESEALELVESGVATGGMMPKLEAGLAALAAGVPKVHLVDGRLPHALLLEILTDRGVGTLLVRDDDPVLAQRAAERAAVQPESGPAWAGTLAERGAAALMPTYARYPLELVSGRGSRVSDSSGREYLDCVAGIAVSVLGHAHPRIVEAIHGAADGLLHVSNLYWTEPMVRLAERLTEASGMERAFFCNSGAEAVEGLLKLVRKARPQRAKLVCFDRSFHGRTLGALSVTAQEKYQAPFRPLLAEASVLAYGDSEAAEASIDDATAGVIVEPLQGEGGMRPAPAGFLARLRELCDERGALLLFDEVQTGLGRTGTLYAFQGERVVPDALSTAKALAGGLPMGAVLARGEAATALQPGDHASTFGGGPFVARVANAVLDELLSEGFLEDVRRKGEMLSSGLQRLVDEYPSLVGTRGRGLMQGLVMDGPRAGELVELLRERGLLTCPAGPDVVRLVPALTIGDAEIDEALGLLADALAALPVLESAR